MEMILITHPEVLEGEHELINELFERGLQDLHLRKYQATEQELLDLLKRIPEEYHSRIVLHHHHYLIRSFRVKGVHFNSYTRELVDFPKEGLLFSRAVHDAKALGSVEEAIDRVLLSPIFPTLSKEGDRSLIPREDIEEEVEQKSYPFELIALGGMTPERIHELSDHGFDGFAVLGGIWETFRKQGKTGAIHAFENYQKELDQWKADA